ncbi:hypothetical protein BVRB_5g115130 [Beta vulgaris subsp. vulgaris]|nr:hypothetical protein BVRB_5g115130 [Beta vulgaris subsp. vulgaris]
MRTHYLRRMVQPENRKRRRSITCFKRGCVRSKSHLKPCLTRGGNVLVVLLQMRIDVEMLTNFLQLVWHFPVSFWVGYAIFFFPL